MNVSEVKRGRKATSEEIEAFSALLRESEVPHFCWLDCVGLKVCDMVQVTAFARFEKEAARLGEDPRWQGVSLEKERRSLFVTYCQERAEEERKSKAPSETDAKREFEALLLEARNRETCHSDSTLIISALFGGNAGIDGLETLYGNDPRWTVHLHLPSFVRDRSVVVVEQGCAMEIREQLFEDFKKRYPFVAPPSKSQEHLVATEEDLVNAGEGQKLERGSKRPPPGSSSTEDTSSQSASLQV